MRLALLTPEWSTGGGIATYCRVLAAAAVAEGHTVTVLAATADPDETPVVADGLRVHPVLCPPSDASAAAERFRDVWSAVVEHAAEDERPELIEAADFAGVAALVAALPSAPPLVTRLHLPLTVLLRHNEGRRVYRDDETRCELERRQIAASTVVSSPTRWLADETVRLMGLDRAPVVVPNPIDEQWLVDEAATMPAATGAVPRVLYFGRLEYRKGVLSLAEAIARCLANGTEADVCFVGGDTTWDGSSMAARMRDVLSTVPGAARACRFLPALPWTALVTEIDRSDLVVLPSRYENFPYACLESMARGKPVLATTGSGFEEIIEPGRTGFLTAPADPVALAAALDDCLADRDRLRDVGRQAWRSVRRLVPSRVVPALLDSYAVANLPGER